MRKLMRFAVMLASAVGAAAQTQPQDKPPEKPLYRFPGLPDEPIDAQGNRRSRLPPGQLFVAPSGEPFRAPPGAPYPIVTWFNQADGDRDGKLDRPEFSADFEQFFNKLDRDRDGVVDASEVGRYEREIVPEVVSPGAGDELPGPPPGGRRPPRRQVRGEGQRNLAGAPAAAAQDDGPKPPSAVEVITGAGVYGIINIPEPVSSMDINLDGRVTRAEMLAASYRRFALLDIDRRGFLRLGDLPRTEAQSLGLGKRKPGRGKPGS